jgi:hypothetical protein
VDWTFGTVLWWMLGLFFWFAVVWMFIAVFADIFRRDMSGWAKAAWIVVIVLLPFLGTLVYMIARPGVLQHDRPATAGGRSTDPAGEIATVAQLHKDGRITDDEFAYLKHQALSH